MPQRKMLMLAAGITAFILVLAGGLVSNLARQPAADTTTTTTLEQPAAQQPVVQQPAANADAASREAAYQEQIRLANERIQQANQQLSQAYQQQQELSRQLSSAQTAASQAQPATSQAQPATAAYAVSADQAGALALSLAPGAQLTRTPDLVRFQGTPAYEVVLDAGTIYIDANSGSVLYDGISGSTVAQAQQPAFQGERSEHEGREHERFEHEGDDDD